MLQFEVLTAGREKKRDMSKVLTALSYLVPTGASCPDSPVWASYAGTLAGLSTAFSLRWRLQASAIKYRRNRPKITGVESLTWAVNVKGDCQDA